MTPSDILRMAREADVWAPEIPLHPRQVERLSAFAALVAAHEREVIAKMFDGPVFAYDYREIADAIRTRGEKP